MSKSHEDCPHLSCIAKDLHARGLKASITNEGVSEEAKQRDREKLEEIKRTEPVWNLFCVIVIGAYGLDIVGNEFFKNSPTCHLTPFLYSIQGYSRLQ